jgi:hypothetical protein
MANFTTQQLQTLKDAYARGVLEIREGDSWVKYNSLSELRQAIITIESELKTGPVPRGSRLVTVNKGY